MSETKPPQPLYYAVAITSADMQALKRIRNHFGENDKTQLEHMAYDVLDRIVKHTDSADSEANNILNDTQ